MSLAVVVSTDVEECQGYFFIGATIDTFLFQIGNKEIHLFGFAATAGQQIVERRRSSEYLRISTLSLATELRCLSVRGNCSTRRVNRPI